MEPGVQKYLEPALKDILSDPVLLAVLKRDGLTVEDIKKLAASYQKHSRARSSRISIHLDTQQAQQARRSM